MSLSEPKWYTFQLK